MIFTDWPFAIFAAIFFPLYFATRGMVRTGLILGASYFFYSWWDWRFLSLLILTTLVDYVAAIKIDENKDPLVRKRWIVLSMSANLVVLGFFKYFNFFIESMAALLASLGINYSIPVLSIILPIGISFYTFQSMSYTIDVYRHKAPAERNLIVFATCVAIFPHLVAGPIIRASRLIPQVRMHHDWSWPRVLRGLEWIMWGFFLKVALADNLAPLVDARFAHPEQYGGAQLAVGAMGFAFQIYGDFAGYSLIAIGLGRIMGFNFGRNFNRPYFATDFSDFWRRWHISLSSWLRDYLYIPLGGSRYGVTRTLTALMITMLLGGLWHGASWSFMIWGGLHGLYLCLNYLWSKTALHARLATLEGIPGAIWTGVCIALTFHAVCFAWIFFRLTSLADIGSCIRKLYEFDAGKFFAGGSADMPMWTLLAGYALATALAVAASRGRPLPEAIARFEPQPFVRGAAWGLSFGMLLLVAALQQVGQAPPFIYFQF
jgi:alginate O-acetyltransferase complex protein AlgI